MSPRRLKYRAVAAVAGLIAFGPGAGSALAAEPTPASDQYSGVAGGSGGGGVLGAAAGGSLPFTGADLVAYVLTGSGIIAIGLTLRRLAARRHWVSDR